MKIPLKNCGSFREDWIWKIICKYDKYKLATCMMNKRTTLVLIVTWFRYQNKNSE